MLQITRADAAAIAAQRAALRDLVRDAVDGGASIGFVLPLPDGELDAYVDAIHGDVAAGTRVVLLADDDEGLAGMVQLDLAQKANARHRAELQKLMVHRRARRQGLGRALMDEAEAAARALGRWLLVLDTTGDGADDLYRALGWTELGPIPGYATYPDGSLCPTIIFWKDLRA